MGNLRKEAAAALGEIADPSAAASLERTSTIPTRMCARTCAGRSQRVLAA